MEAFKAICELAWQAYKAYDRLTENCAEARDTVARLQSATSLCRMIGSSGPKQLWVGLEEDLGTLREAVTYAQEIAAAALPLPKSANWAAVAWSGCARFFRANSMCVVPPLPAMSCPAPRRRLHGGVRARARRHFPPYLYPPPGAFPPYLLYPPSPLFAATSTSSR